MREDDSPGAARVMAMVVPHFPGGGPALQFDVRLTTGGTPIELSSTVQNIALPVRLAVQRRGAHVEVFYSADGGTTWVKPLGAQGGDVQMPGLGTTGQGRRDGRFLRQPPRPSRRPSTISRSASRIPR